MAKVMDASGVWREVVFQHGGYTGEGPQAKAAKAEPETVAPKTFLPPEPKDRHHREVDV